MAHGDQAAKARTVLASHMACQIIDVGDGKAEAQRIGVCRDERANNPRTRPQPMSNSTKGRVVAEGRAKASGTMW